MDGSFKCVCDSGYKLSSDGKTCIGTIFKQSSICSIRPKIVYSTLIRYRRV
jgi:hypothetical protein